MRNVIISAVFLGLSMLGASLQVRAAEEIVIEKSPFKSASARFREQPCLNVRETEKAEEPLTMSIYGVTKDSGEGVLVPWDNITIVVDGTAISTLVSYVRAQATAEVDKMTLYVPNETVKERWVAIAQERITERNREFAECRAQHLEFEARWEAQQKREQEFMQNVLAGKEFHIVHPE